MYACSCVPSVTAARFYFLRHLEVFGELLPALIARVHGDEVSHVSLEPDDLAVARKDKLLGAYALRVRDCQHLQQPDQE